MGPDDPDLHELLDTPGGDPPPGADELRAIVGRVPRRRWGVVSLAAACTLALGLGVGYAVSNHSSRPRDVVATGPGTTTAGGAATQAPAVSGRSGRSGQGTSPGAANSSESGNGISPAIGFLGPDRYTYLFTRTTGDITVRGYRLDPGAAGGSPVGCGLVGPQFQAEVSTPKVVGIVDGVVATTRTQPLTAARAQVIGVSEGDPAIVAIAATGPGVAQVRATFTGGATDSMTPMDGWVVLAAPTPLPASGGSAAPASGGAVVPASGGTLTAFNSAGKVLATVPISSAAVPGPVVPLPHTETPGTAAPGSVPPATVSPGAPVSPGVTVSPGATGGSSGSAGSGSAASGSASGSPSVASGSPAAGDDLVVPCRIGATPTPAVGSNGGAK